MSTQGLNYSTLATRRLWTTYWAARVAYVAEWDAHQERQDQAHHDARLDAVRRGRARPKLTYTPPPVAPAFPRELEDLRCGATTRGGWPCKRRDLNRGARCKLHGGLSTGPTTKTGKTVSAANGLWRQRTEAHEELGKARIPDTVKGARSGAASRGASRVTTSEPHERLTKADISTASTSGATRTQPRRRR